MAENDERNIFHDIKLSDVKGCSDSSSDTDIDARPLKEQINERYKQDTRFRKHLARWVMWLVPVWLGCVIAIIILCAFGVCNLPNSVLSVLLATTTANVLGLAHIVLKGIYK